MTAQRFKRQALMQLADNVKDTETYRLCLERLKSRLPMRLRLTTSPVRHRGSRAPAGDVILPGTPVGTETMPHIQFLTLDMPLRGTTARGWIANCMANVFFGENWTSPRSSLHRQRHMAAMWERGPVDVKHPCHLFEGAA
jgi:hypothetical protein